MFKINQYPSQERLNQLFRYDNGRLFWKVKLSNAVDITKEAGTLKVDGYRRIAVNQVTLYTHRFIYIMFLGDIPDGQIIDHIDENPFNNKIENLRSLTRVQNIMRVSKGYSWYKRYGKWRASIGYMRKCIFLGYYETKEEAREKYLEARMLLYGI